MRSFRVTFSMIWPERFLMTTNGFELIRDEHIEEINTKARLYRHIGTGAEILSMENDDENKVFGITFRTPPSDSTGVPHIMEHSVLCGSKKYPLKEPFIELVKGSLNTFLNAMTYPDKTTYPVASQNEQDFYNLVDVYLDAVLHPLIPEETLLQEGWHYEAETADEPITYKGVVFNEMKGVYSSPDSLLYRGTQQALFPDVTYGVDSGGDPAHIPDLTYEQFKAFHETYYHPSNARLYFYGDDDPAKRLAQVASYLDAFNKQHVDSSVGLQASFSEPQTHVHTYEAGDNEEGSQKSMMTLSWLLPENTDRNQTMLLGLLSYILVGTPASPLRKALLDSGIGEEQTGGGLATHLRQMYFSTGLKGIQAEDCEKVETLVLDTLETIAKDGIDSDMIEAALNMTEFHLRENNTGSYPRGLSLMLHILSTWLHDQDPIEAARYEGPLQYVKEALRSNEEGGPLYQSAPLQDIIRKHFLDNTHRVTVLLKPEQGVQKQLEEREAERLKQVEESLDAEAKQALVDQTLALKKQQGTPDPPELLAKLPSLTLGDLDKTNKLIPIDTDTHNGAELLVHDLFTNHIIYLDVGFDLSTLPKEWLPYVSLFGKALVEIGTQTEDDVKIAQRIRRKTGGIHASSFLAAHIDGEHTTSKLFLHAKVASDKTDELLDILHDLLLTANFDNKERFRQMVRKSKANAEAGMIPNGHGIVNARLRARIGGPDQISEYMGGINKLFFLRTLLEQIESDWSSVLTILNGIRSHLINRNTALCNITTDGGTWHAFAPKLKGFLDRLPAGDVNRHEWTFDLEARDEGLVLPAQVNYVGKGANLYKLGYQHHGSIAVISKFLRTSWLWDKVRVQGGAYGGMCRFSRRTGIFTFLSYRDPNVNQTLQAYDQTGQFLRELHMNDRELARSIIGTIGDVDSYQLPDSKGYSSMVRYLTGETDEYRQTIREQILSTSLKHFHEFGDALEAMKEQGLVVVLGSQEALEQANKESGRDLQLLKVM